MISPDYFAQRWSWYRPLFDRLDQPSDCCHIDVRRFPLHVTGADADEYIPYAVHPEAARTIRAAVQRLHELAVRYIVRREKVSAHQLPAMDASTRELMIWLRHQHPHLSRELLHHWSADARGGKTLNTLCEALWQQAWKQSQADATPWMPAINILLLRLIRQNVSAFSESQANTTDHVMLSVLGSFYTWSLQRFLKGQLEGRIEINQITGYEAIVLPVTPIAFMPNQPEDFLLADDNRLIRAYGLEPEIVPRMRALLAISNEADDAQILPLLAREKLGEHMLRRSWARLSLWQLARKSGQGDWMRWVLDAKLLDQLLNDRNQLDPAMQEALSACPDEAIATWLLNRQQKRRMGKSSDKPWLHDKITLLAFRVFEADIQVEIARRAAEQRWLDCAPNLSGEKPEQRNSGKLRGGRNIETAKTIEQAWQDGRLVLIRPDPDRALHSGKSLSAHQGCLSVRWSELLFRMYTRSHDIDVFLSDRLIPTLQNILNTRQGLFLDACSASGCQLRGAVPLLLEVAIDLRRYLSEQRHGMSANKSDDDDDTLPMAISIDILGDWTIQSMQIDQQVDQKTAPRIAFSPAIVRADAALTHDKSLAQLMLARDAAQSLKPLGGINIEPIRADNNQALHLLHNEGVALTGEAVQELTRLMQGKAGVRTIRVGELQARKLMNGYRLPTGGLDLLIIEHRGEQPLPPWLLLRIGKVNLAGIETEIFELLDDTRPATRLILDQGLKLWQ